MKATMQATDVLTWANCLGVKLEASGDKLRYAPIEAVSPEFVEALRKHKRELLAALKGPQRSSSAPPLPEPKLVVEEVSRLMALGQRLKRGEIKAIRCGITGQVCAVCQGVGCWGSQPWED